MAAYSVNQVIRDALVGRSQTLLSETVTTAVTATTTTAVEIGPTTRSVALQCVFTYGSSGTSATYRVQTSFDGGTTWIDIANFAHTTASLNRVYNLSSLTPVTTVYTVLDGTLTDNTAKDGLIGSLLRVKRTTVGTYAGSTTVAIYAHSKP